MQGPPHGRCCSASPSGKLAGSASLEGRGQLKFTSGRWSPHHSCTQVATASDTAIRGWDTRTMRSVTGARAVPVPSQALGARGSSVCVSRVGTPPVLLPAQTRAGLSAAVDRHCSVAVQCSGGVALGRGRGPGSGRGPRQWGFRMRIMVRLPDAARGAGARERSLGGQRPHVNSLCPGRVSGAVCCHFCAFETVLTYRVISLSLQSLCAAASSSYGINQSSVSAPGVA